MSFDIPASMEPGIQEFAHAHHISSEEAIARLLEVGLKVSLSAHIVKTPPTSRIPGLTGEPMSDEEAAVMDEVVEMAMQSRNSR